MKLTVATLLIASVSAFSPAAFTPRAETKLFGGDGEYGASSTSF